MFPGFGLRIHRVAISGKGGNPRFSITIDDLGCDVKGLADIEASRGSPAQRRDEEQIHVRIVEPIFLSEALIRAFDRLLRPTSSGNQCRGTAAALLLRHRLPHDSRDHVVSDGQNDRSRPRRTK
jgi:hypothetical protein